MSFLPPDTGMAFVLIQHLDPRHHSILTELLAKKTVMTVQEVSDSLHVLPNYVYVIPPNTVSIAGDTLLLGPREETHGKHMPIDTFMRALAQQKRNRAVGVILSGTGLDGTLGMAEIQVPGAALPSPKTRIRLSIPPCREAPSRLAASISPTTARPPSCAGFAVAWSRRTPRVRSLSARQSRRNQSPVSGHFDQRNQLFPRSGCVRRAPHFYVPCPHEKPCDATRPSRLTPL